jgi:hypothetical protein
MTSKWDSSGTGPFMQKNYAMNLDLKESVSWLPDESVMFLMTGMYLLIDHYPIEIDVFDWFIVKIWKVKSEKSEAWKTCKGGGLQQAL